MLDYKVSCFLCNDSIKHFVERYRGDSITATEIELLSCLKYLINVADRYSADVVFWV